MYKDFLFFVSELGIIRKKISFITKKLQVCYCKNYLNLKIIGNIYKNIAVKDVFFFEIIQIISKLNTFSKQKLLLYGIGFRCWTLKKKETFKNYIFLKLGFSNDICIIVPSYIKIACLRSSSLLLKSYDMIRLKQFIVFLCSLRSLDMYKGKGLTSFSNNIFVTQIKKT